MLIRLLAAAAATVQTVPAHADDVVGPVRVVDGDTLVIGATHIRLAGIDAPETDQVCLDALNAGSKMTPKARVPITRTVHDNTEQLHKLIDILRKMLDRSGVAAMGGFGGEGTGAYGRGEGPMFRPGGGRTGIAPRGTPTSKSLGTGTHAPGGRVRAYTPPDLLKPPLRNSPRSVFSMPACAILMG